MTSYQELNADLLAAQVPKEWFLNAQRQGLSLRVGDLYGSKGSSLWICLRTGRWFDHATGEGGRDLVSLYAARHNISQLQAKMELAGEGLHRALRAPKSTKAPNAENIKKIEYVKKLWTFSTPAQGTVVEAYLKSRAITLLPPINIRAVPALYHVPTQQEFPAMLAAVRHGVTGQLMAVHRTWLKPDGSGKADINPNKMMLGEVLGGAVQLADAASKIIVAEGIETALSVMQRTGVPAWAALSTAGLKRLVMPSACQKIIIACDNDPAGIKAAHDAADKWTKEGREVSLAIPPVNRDFNDLLMGGISER